MVMSVSFLMGCGSSDADGNPQTGAETEESTVNVDAEKQETGNTEEQSGDWEGEVSKIVMTYPTAGVVPTDLGLVLDYINEISTRKVGVEIELKPVSIFEIPSQCPMWIGAGEQIDLMCVAFSGLQPYVDQGMIDPMDEYLESCAPYLQNLAKEQPVYDTTSEGVVYGVMQLPSAMGFAGGYLISVEDLEAAGLSYQDGDMITLDDLDNIFAKIKEARPDVYPCGIIGSATRAGMTYISDPLGATSASGVLMGLDSTKVVNMYATEEYKNYLDHVRDWYEKGYILKDAATTDISMSEMTKSNTLSGYFSERNAGLKINLSLNNGREYIHLMMNEPYLPAISAASGSYWTIPVTSKEPEAAVRFLNLMYEDPRIPNAFVWGLEERHWVFMDEKDGSITYPEGVDSTSTGYAYGFGLYGQQADNYTMGVSSREEDAAWTETALGRKTRGYGFCYDSSAMTNQIIAVQAVITEYKPALETGSANLDTVYPEFLKKLEDNGINEIIADKQAQFDAWLSQQ